MRAVIMNSGGKVGVETLPDPTLPGPSKVMVGSLEFGVSPT
jgi:hypothetical protein